VVKVPHGVRTSHPVVLAFTKQRTSQSLPLHGFDNTIEYIRKIPNLAAFIDRRITGCHSACNIDPLSRGIGVQN